MPCLQESKEGEKASGAGRERHRKLRTALWKYPFGCAWKAHGREAEGRAEAAPFLMVVELGYGKGEVWVSCELAGGACRHCGLMGHGPGKDPGGSLVSNCRAIHHSLEILYVGRGQVFGRRWLNFGRVE